MLEVRKGTFVRNYENLFFRDFSRCLDKVFREKNMDGILLGSPFCAEDEKLQIDALLITSNAVCIIDFKNFGGNIHLPMKDEFEKGLWKTTDEKLVKGGNSCNPFQQLRKQKLWFQEVARRHIVSTLRDGDVFNPSHAMLAVCFQEEVNLVGEIPPEKILNFHIFDKTNFVEKILDIIDIHDGEVKLGKESFEAFKRLFRADEYKIDDKPLEDKLKNLAEKSVRLNYGTLYPDQREALIAIKSFLENPEQRVFILQGTTNSGKSHLIPFIQEIAFQSGIQETELFAQSSRVANNLLKEGGAEKVNSMYSFIFGGKSVTAEEVTVVDEESGENEDIHEEERRTEEVPLRKCSNSAETLFIVDESQLINDDLYEPGDIRFGSGRLLKDFITFTDLQKTKRKIIFIGDPYQLGTRESALDATCLETAYNIKPIAMQLLDKPTYSKITKGALSCVDGMRRGAFNALKLEHSPEVVILDENTRLNSVADLLREHFNGCVLFYSNEEAQKFNEWVKKSVINTRERITANDVVLFCNNITVENEADPFSEPKKIYNGQFATVLEVGRELPARSVSIKKGMSPVDLHFQELLVELKETGKRVKILELQNYRNNAKGEISTAEQIALRTTLNSLLRERMEKEPFEESPEYRETISSEKFRNHQEEINRLTAKLGEGEKVKGKKDEAERQQKKLLKAAKKLHRNRMESSLRRDPSSEYFQIQNAARLKFGWAMTTHKSRSYKWRVAVLNFEKGSGKTNEEFFRFIYTGLSRAKDRIFIINYAPVTPLDRVVITDKSTGPAPKKYWYVSDKKDKEAIRTEINKRVSSLLKDRGVATEKVEHQNWEERFHIKSNDKTATVAVYFNHEGRVRNPRLVKGNVDLGETIIQCLKQEPNSFDFSVFVKSDWRKSFYERLAAVLNASRIRFVNIQPSKYKDSIRMVGFEQNASIDFVYNAKGAITHISAIHYSMPKIWEDIQQAIGTIQKEGL